MVMRGGGRGVGRGDSRSDSAVDNADAEVFLCFLVPFPLLVCTCKAKAFALCRRGVFFTGRFALCAEAVPACGSPG